MQFNFIKIPQILQNNVAKTPCHFEVNSRQDVAIDND